MAEEIYNLKYSGEETDEILESAKNVKEANLTTLNDISGFVCIDKNGNAIGMMSKEQVASVVGGLLNIYGGKNWSINNGSFDDMPTGFFYGNYNTDDWDSYNAPFQYGHVTICINNEQSGLQISLPETSSISNSIYFRRKWSNKWSEWKHSIGE